ncbi:uridylate kinase [Ilyonectria destructans]|nr:uridylate kinase [Ilyonectria destructans]
MAARMPLLPARLLAAAARSSPRASSSSSSLGFSRSLRQTTRRSYSSQSPRNDKVKFWPFIAIIGLGSLGYMGLANLRIGMPQKLDAPAVAGQLPQPAKPTPTFSPADVTVVFVLGGPGAGKGTQCSKLVEQYGFIHLSAGDLLRAEQERPGSQFGELIKDYIKNGLIVPMEVTIQLLENAMTEALQKAGSTKGRFLVDGFPRKMDQAVKFEETVCPAKMVLFFDCPEEVMEKRLLKRGETSGRSDDNAESIRKRFRTFVETSMPVVNYFEKEGKVVKLDATPTPDQVYVKTQLAMTERLSI